MPVLDELEVVVPAVETPGPDNPGSLAEWLWELRDAPPETPVQDWFWAEEEVRRQQLTTACEAGKEPEEI